MLLLQSINRIAVSKALLPLDRLQAQLSKLSIPPQQIKGEGKGWKMYWVTESTFNFMLLTSIFRRSGVGFMKAKKALV
jgi:hypothetical protein